VVYILNGLVHISVLIGLLLFLRETYLLISDAPNHTERKYRLLALSLGFLIFLGARAVGLDVPELIAISLSRTTPVRFAITGVLLPAGGGVLAAWLLQHGRRRSTTADHRVRLTILLSTFTTVLFADVYAELSASTAASPGQMNTHLLPNLTFFIGLSLYILFGSDHASNGTGGNKWEDGL